jgi:ribonucleoside-diphosphate reductase alpha chain
LALQHGVPLKLLCDKFSHTRFEPSGWSGNPEIGFSKSIMDYIFRWLQLRFLTGQQYLLFKDMKAPGTAAAPSPEDSGAQPPSSAASRLLGPRPMDMGATTPPQGGIASTQQPAASSSTGMEDRGIYHASDAMKDLVDMGDAPSCHVCGAIMTRNGSCYRCMSCGSTSGCS